MKIHLPKGLRLELVDNTDLTVEVGHKMTIVWENEILDTESFTTGVMVLLDGDSMTSMIPFSQCKIITDNFKKTFKPNKQGE